MAGPLKVVNVSTKVSQRFGRNVDDSNIPQPLVSEQDVRLVGNHLHNVAQVPRRVRPEVIALKVSGTGILKQGLVAALVCKMWLQWSENCVKCNISR